MTNETDNITNDEMQKMQAELRKSFSNDTIAIRRSGMPNVLAVFVGDKFAGTLTPDIDGDEGDFTFHRAGEVKSPTEDEIKKLQAQLRKAFSDDSIVLRQGISNHTIDTFKGDKFIGIISCDVEDGEKTYTFHAKISNL